MENLHQEAGEREGVADDYRWGAVKAREAMKSQNYKETNSGSERKPVGGRRVSGRNRALCGIMAKEGDGRWAIDPQSCLYHFHF